MCVAVPHTSELTGDCDSGHNGCCLTVRMLSLKRGGCACAHCVLAVVVHAVLLVPHASCQLGGDLDDYRLALVFLFSQSPTRHKHEAGNVSVGDPTVSKIFHRWRDTPGMHATNQHATGGGINQEVRHPRHNTRETSRGLTKRRGHKAHETQRFTQRTEQVVAADLAYRPGNEEAHENNLSAQLPASIIS